MLKINWCDQCDELTLQASTNQGGPFCNSGNHPVAFKMPKTWSEQMGLPDVGPIWKDYAITAAEFLARQGNWDENGRRINR